MLTNERRAHDLAMASLNYLLSNGITSSKYFKKDGNEEPYIDIFEVYIDLYNDLLKDFRNNPTI